MTPGAIYYIMIAEEKVRIRMGKSGYREYGRFFSTDSSVRNRILYESYTAFMRAAGTVRRDMEELYRIIEDKIKASGYPREISGRAVYNDICDQIEGKENGTYLLLSKFEADVLFEYNITIMDEEFNLGTLVMRTPEGVFETNFDE